MTSSVVGTTPPVVLITGASRGLGRAAAVECARLGARLVIHYGANELAAAETLSMARAVSPNVDVDHVVLQADLRDAVHCQQLVAQALEKCGRIDSLVNNAGVFFEEADITPARRAEMTNVNSTATANLMFVVGQHMRKRRESVSSELSGSPAPIAPVGRIVNLASRGAFRADAPGASYNASKALCGQLALTCARSWGKHGIACFSVAPTMIETDMTREYFSAAVIQQHPIGRTPTPEECGRVVAFAALQCPLASSGTTFDVAGASFIHH